MDPADEFAEIRAQIANLERRSKELRTAFVSGLAPLKGSKSEVVISRKPRRSFNQSALPKYILEAPELWTTTETIYIVAKALDDAGGRPKPQQAVNDVSQFSRPERLPEPKPSAESQFRSEGRARCLARRTQAEMR